MGPCDGMCLLREVNDDVDNKWDSNCPTRIPNTPPVLTVELTVLPVGNAVADAERQIVPPFSIARTPSQSAPSPHHRTRFSPRGPISRVAGRVRVFYFRFVRKGGALDPVQWNNSRCSLSSLVLRLQRWIPRGEGNVLFCSRDLLGLVRSPLC